MIRIRPKLKPSRYRGTKMIDYSGINGESFRPLSQADTPSKSTILQVIGVLVISTAAWHIWDIPLAEFWHNAPEESIFVKIFTFLNIWGDSKYCLVPSGMIFLAFNRYFPILAKKAAFVFVSVASGGILVNIVKVIVSRARPVLWFTSETYGFYWFQIDYHFLSFPSGHSATAMGLAMALSRIHPGWCKVYLLAGALIAASRMVVGAHYFSDVMVGGLLGAVVTSWVWDRWFRESPCSC